MFGEEDNSPSASGDWCDVCIQKKAGRNEVRDFKTALILRLVRNVFVLEYEPTLEDSYCIQAVIDGKSCTLCITDTSGMVEYSSMLDDQIRRADARRNPHFAETSYVNHHTTRRWLSS